MLGKFRPNQTITLNVIFLNQDGTRASLKIPAQYFIYDNTGTLVDSGSMAEIGTEYIYYKNVSFSTLGNYFVIYRGTYLGTTLNVETTDSFIISDEWDQLSTAIGDLSDGQTEILTKLNDIEALIPDLGDRPTGEF